MEKRKAKVKEKGEIEDSARISGRLTS